MSTRRARRPGQQGFSLFDLQEDIASATESLGGALSRQGVNVNQDQLFMALQNVMQSLGGSNINSNGSSYGYSALAADTQEIPYSVAGDLICMAHEYFQLGNKKEALKNMLTAMESDDFSQIAQGLLEMNRLAEKTNRSIFANQEENTEDSNEDIDEEDSNEDIDEEDSNENDSTDDFTDEDINDLIEDSNDDNETTAEDEIKSEDKKSKEKIKNEENETENKSDSDNSIPMGKTSSTIEASMTAKILANKLSLQGDKTSRNRATNFIKKHSRL